MNVLSLSFPFSSLLCATNKGLYNVVLNRTDHLDYPLTVLQEQLATKERLGDNLERQLAGGPAIGYLPIGGGTQNFAWGPAIPATKSLTKKIPPESARVGAEDGVIDRQHGISPRNETDSENDDQHYI